MRRVSPMMRAFVLMELLVVISIIALLAAALLPTLSAARSHARRACCQSNLHQIGLALDAYAEDFRCFPTARVKGPPDSEDWERCGNPYCLLPHVLTHKGYIPLSDAGWCPEVSERTKYMYNASPETGLCRTEWGGKGPPGWLAACAGQTYGASSTWRYPVSGEDAWLKSDIVRTNAAFPFWLHGGKRLVLYTDARVELDRPPLPQELNTRW